MGKEFICRCGFITYTQTERRKHLKSRMHYYFQKQLEYINNNDLNIISVYKLY